MAGRLDLQTPERTPFTVVLNSDRAGTKTDTTGTSLGQFPDLVLSDNCRTLTTSDPNRWIKTECFTFPEQFTLGNVGRNTLRKAGISNLDFSVSKTFKPTESIAMQFRAELFNILNQTISPRPIRWSSTTRAAFRRLQVASPQRARSPEECNSRLSSCFETGPSPLLPAARGGCASKRRCEASEAAQTGWWFRFKTFLFRS